MSRFFVCLWITYCHLVTLFETIFSQLVDHFKRESMHVLSRSNFMLELISARSFNTFTATNAFTRHWSIYPCATHAFTRHQLSLTNLALSHWKTFISYLFTFFFNKKRWTRHNTVIGLWMSHVFYEETIVKHRPL